MEYLIVITTIVGDEMKVHKIKKVYSGAKQALQDFTRLISEQAYKHMKQGVKACITLFDGRKEEILCVNI